ncbi:MAG: hypothetical protein ABTD50_17755 [Polyangiaceae bacterium]
MRFAPMWPLLLAACINAPAARTPLHERLAPMETSQIEAATRSCLESVGWHVDPIPGEVGGTNAVSAFKKDDRTQVLIYGPDMNPRITGGPDYADPFWSCLEQATKPGAHPPAPKGDAP